MVVLDDLCLLAEDETKRPPYIADVEWLVVRVEKKYDAVHRSLKPAGTRPGDARIVAKVSVNTFWHAPPLLARR
jgi:hypothetical protein